MDFSEVKELIGLINDSDLAYFEIKNEKDYIKIGFFRVLIWKVLTANMPILTTVLF